MTYNKHKKICSDSQIHKRKSQKPTVIVSTHRSINQNQTCSKSKIRNRSVIFTHRRAHYFSELSHRQC